jgi:myo-inositol-1-phosphate synthase
MSPVLDGFATHMRDYHEDRTYVLAEAPAPDGDEIVSILRRAEAHVLVNYLPVGSEQATRFYAECALQAGTAFVNCVPVFIASDAQWAGRFARAGLPIIGDDVKSQMGATIVHRVLADLFRKRACA